MLGLLVGSRGLWLDYGPTSGAVLYPFTRSFMGLTAVASCHHLSFSAYPLEHMGYDVPSLPSTVSLLFGGCCTNAVSLEFLLKDNPAIGGFSTRPVDLNLRPQPDRNPCACYH